MPPAMFWLARCHLKNFKMAANSCTCISEQNSLSNSESPCCLDVTHKVSAHPTYGLGPKFFIS